MAFLFGIANNNNKTTKLPLQIRVQSGVQEVPEQLSVLEREVPHERVQVEQVLRDGRLHEATALGIDDGGGGLLRLDHLHHRGEARVGSLAESGIDHVRIDAGEADVRLARVGAKLFG